MNRLLKKYSILLSLCLLLQATATCFAAEEKSTPAEPPKQKNTKTTTQTHSGAFFSFDYSKDWSLSEGQGYAQLTGKGKYKGCSIRIYAIGLKSAGGKYRDLEHAVDDGIFQIRDEFKGSVSKKSDYLFKDGQGAQRKARQFTGQCKHGKVWWLVLPHTAQGVVVAANLIAPKNFDAGKEALAGILSSLSLSTPPPAKAK